MTTISCRCELRAEHAYVPYIKILRTFHCANVFYAFCAYVCVFSSLSCVCASYASSSGDHVIYKRTCDAFKNCSFTIMQVIIEILMGCTCRALSN